MQAADVGAAASDAAEELEQTVCLLSAVCDYDCCKALSPSTTHNSLIIHTVSSCPSLTDSVTFPNEPEQVCSAECSPHLLRSCTAHVIIIADREYCLLQSSTWGSAVWNTVTAPVSYLSSGIRRLSGHVER